MIDLAKTSNSTPCLGAFQRTKVNRNYHQDDYILLMGIIMILITSQVVTIKYCYIIDMINMKIKVLEPIAPRKTFIS